MCVNYRLPCKLPEIGQAPGVRIALLALLPTSPAPCPPPCSASVKIFVNLETTEKIYTTGEHLCPMDGFVCFFNSHLIRWVAGWLAGRRCPPIHAAACSS